MIKQLLFPELVCHESIDTLPAWNWFRIHQTNDLTWLCVKKPKSIRVKQVKKLNTVWGKIYDEFIDTFGIPELLKKALELRREIAVMKAEMLMSGDRSQLTFIEIKEFELEELTKGKESDSVSTVTSYMIKFYGVNIDEKVISVSDYYRNLRMMEKEISKTSKQ